MNILIEMYRRKGALGVGSRVGGLGQMPGWWFTVESMTTKHLTHQFKMAIHDALGSSQETRALMRARSAKQRFPVAQWVEDLNKLQSTAIKISHEQREKEGRSRTIIPSFRSRPSSPNPQKVEISWPLPQTPSDSGLASPSLPFLHSPNPGRSRSGSNVSTLSARPDYLDPNWDNGLNNDRVSLELTTPRNMKRASTLSLRSVIGERTDFALQKVDPFFTDASGHYYRDFERKLEDLGPKNSETSLSIEDHLVKSEKQWFEQFKNAKAGLGSSRNVSSTSLHKIPKGSRSNNGLNSSASSLYGGRGDRTSPPQPHPLMNQDDPYTSAFDETSTINSDNSEEQFDLGRDYIPPHGLQRFMLRKIGDWPVYSLFLAFGQIIAANSYQISLLTGEIGQTASMLYIIASIYAVTSIMWWFVFRRFPSVYCLSIPFVFYGFAFLLVGVAPFVHSFEGRGWVQHVATGCYTVASSSGSLFFALNFGDEG